MLMTANTVGMTVIDFFGRRFAHWLYVDRKTERLTGQWVIGVKINIKLTYFNHGRVLLTLWSIHLNHCTHRHFFGFNG